MTQFAADLTAWLQKHSLTYYSAAPILDVPERTVGRWAAGETCRHETAFRALMREYDRGQGKK
jgi:hypothetical protein